MEARFRATLLLRVTGLVLGALTCLSPFAPWATVETVDPRTGQVVSRETYNGFQLEFGPTGGLPQLLPIGVSVILGLAVLAAILSGLGVFLPAAILAILQLVLSLADILFLGGGAIIERTYIFREQGAFLLAGFSLMSLGTFTVGILLDAGGMHAGTAARPRSG